MEQNTSQSDHYKISNKLPLIGISALVIIIFGIIFMNSPDIKYHVSTEEMLEITLERKDLVRPAEFMHIYFSKDTAYRYIDLRPADEYLISHLDGAINIPVHHLLDDEFKDLLNQDKKINVLYYSDQCGACGPWMILKQIGYPNNKILQGGYEYVKQNIIDDYSPMTGNFSDEKAKYNFKEVINNTSGVQSNNNKSKKESTEDVIIIQKDNTKEEGGC